MGSSIKKKNKACKIYNASLEYKKQNGVLKMRRDTSVKIVKQGRKVENEKKKRYDYSTKELQLERELSYAECTRDILKTIKL